jgi:acetyl esterase/lipase
LGDVTELSEAASFFGAMLRAVVRRVDPRNRRTETARPRWPILYEAAVDTMRAHTVRTAGMVPHAQRAHAEFLVRPTAAVRAVPRHATVVGGVSGAWFKRPREREPASADEDGGAPLLLYFHGGGYVFGSVRTHADLVARIVLAGIPRALSLDYRLAPEHPYPAAVDDAVAAFRALVAQGVRPETITLAGDSAGGGLALATAVRLRDEEGPLPGALVLFSPWVELATTAPSYAAYAGFDWGTVDALNRWAGWYAGGRPLDDPGISPVHADLAGLPPILVHVGGAELLVDDVRKFVERARAAGTAVTLREWPDLVHDFVAFHPFVDAADRAVEELVAFAKARTL